MSNRSIETCSFCGEPMGPGHERAIRMELPDVVLGLPRADYTHNAAEAIRSDFLTAYIHGRFRHYMRVLLDNGRICAWLEGTEDDVHAFTKVWHNTGGRYIGNHPERYVGHRIIGHLANGVPPFGDAVLGAECTVEALQPDQLPHVIASTNPTLQRALVPATT